MSATYNWLVIAALALVAYATRIVMIAWLGRTRLAPQVQRALRLTVPAMFMAIVLPNVLTWQGQLALTLSNPHIPSALVAAVVAWRTRSMLWTIVSGMLVLWIWRMIAA